MSALEDGTYDVIVVDAQEQRDGVITLDCAVSSGAHRGDVVRVSASQMRRTWFELLAAPGTLTVTDGEPHLTLD
jgi:hypothetical protein